MPLTWFAHQVPVIGVKMARPRWVDATAMCIGSMVPDVMYSFSAYVDIDTHRWPAFTYGVPITVAVAMLVRFVVAPIAANQLPDLGDFRLHSYAVLSRRRPRIVMTVVASALGIASHIVIDWFTHPGRPGTRWFGYDDLDIHVAGRTEPLASVFQLVGHTLGSLAGVMLLLLVGRRRLLEQWYGSGAVAESRAWRPSSSQRLTFWLAVVLGTIGGAAWGLSGDSIELIHRTAVGSFVGVVAGSVTNMFGGRRLSPGRGRAVVERV
jgi:hypothetical protein